jgi:hypothetical protein
MAKVKVFNKNKFDVGIKLINPVREQNIRAGSFTIIDEDDIYYLNSICGLFRDGSLCVEEKPILETMGFVEDNPNVISDAEIEDLLKGNFLKMKKQLSEINEAHVKNNIYHIALKNASNLSGGKLKFLTEYCERPILVDDIEN